MKKGKIITAVVALVVCAAVIMAVLVPIAGAPKIKTAKTETESSSNGQAGALTKYDAQNADYTLEIDASNKIKHISELLYGVFLEDINFAADGGLYAEMVQNRSFEFNEIAKGNEKHAWSDIGEISANVKKGDKAGCLNPNNPNYMVLTNGSSEKAGIANSGFLEGMAVKKGESYNFSVYLKSADYKGKLYIQLKCGDKTAASAELDGITNEWKKFNLTLTSELSANKDVTLALLIDKGSVSVDMVSLIPKSADDNMRADLVQALKELEPKFLRFPGGCVIEGHTLDLAYDWKDSVGADENGEPYKFNGVYGDVAARKMGQNIWINEDLTDDPYPSYMTYGLGFYEYFCLAEKIGAVGVPVINCGICCMGRGDQTQYAKIGSEEMNYYIQNMLDLVEFCRGGASTKWGAVRIAMGHTEPFELKYIGIGNEQWGKAFYTHYAEFVKAFNKAKAEKPDLYKGIELIYSSGVDDGDSNNPDYLPSYTNAEEWLKNNPGKSLTDFAGATDQHYYNDPGWFLTHTDYYDEGNYSRDEKELDSTKYGGGIPVFLGEYAARSNTWKAGLAEAAYMTGLERNGDIVKMAAYAPLFGNTTATHWSPNLIWFNNTSVTKSVDYYAQQVFSINQGTDVLKHSFSGTKSDNADDLKGKVGLGTWNTSAKFDNLVITDNETGEVLAKDNFNRYSLTDNWEAVSDGKWSVLGGKLSQKSKETDTEKYNNTGTVMYFGDTDWSNYSLTVDAKKTGGSEGFLIPFAVSDKDNNIFWNIGGWWNTKSALQRVDGASKSAEIPGTEKEIEIEKGRTYKLKVVVSGRNVKCYIDGELYVDYDVPETTLSDVYSVVSADETGDTIIKLVNVCDKVKTVAIDVKNADKIKPQAELYKVVGTSPDNDNILGEKEVVSLNKTELDGVSPQFNYALEPYSITVIRLAK